jgi:hypothetical protein
MVGLNIYIYTMLLFFLYIYVYASIYIYIYKSVAWWVWLDEAGGVCMVVEHSDGRVMII